MCWNCLLPYSLLCSLLIICLTIHCGINPWRPWLRQALTNYSPNPRAQKTQGCEYNQPCVTKGPHPDNLQITLHGNILAYDCNNNTLSEDYNSLLIEDWDVLLTRDCSPRSFVGMTGMWKILELFFVIVFPILGFKKILTNAGSQIKIFHIYIFIVIIINITIWKNAHLTHSETMYILLSTTFLLCRRKNPRVGIDFKSICKVIDDTLKLTMKIPCGKTTCFDRRSNKCKGELCQDEDNFYKTIFSLDRYVSTLISPHNYECVIVYLAQELSRLASFRPLCNGEIGNPISFIRLAAAGFRYSAPGACECDGCGRRHNLSHFRTHPSDPRYHSHPCTIASGRGVDGGRDDNVRQEQSADSVEFKLSKSLMSMAYDPRRHAPAAPPFRFVWDDAQAAAASATEDPRRSEGQAQGGHNSDSSEDEQPEFSPQEDYSSYMSRLRTIRLIGLPVEYWDCIDVIAFNGFYQDGSEPCCFICYKCRCKRRDNMEALLTGCLSPQCSRHDNGSQPANGPTNANAISDLTLRVLRKENELLRRKQLCQICRIKERRVLFLPCGHLLTCAECSVNLRACPICKRSILHRIETHFS